MRSSSSSVVMRATSSLSLGLPGTTAEDAVEIGQGAVAGVETQIGLALLGVGAVAGKAVVTE